jgi:hypothetical protein
VTERQLLLQHDIFGEFVRTNKPTTIMITEDASLKNAEALAEILNMEVMESEFLLNDLWLRGFIYKEVDKRYWLKNSGIVAFREQTLIIESLKLKVATLSIGTTDKRIHTRIFSRLFNLKKN